MLLHEVGVHAPHWDRLVGDLSESCGNLYDVGVGGWRLHTLLQHDTGLLYVEHVVKACRVYRPPYSDLKRVIEHEECQKALRALRVNWDRIIYTEAADKVTQVIDAMEDFIEERATYHGEEGWKMLFKPDIDLVWKRIEKVAAHNWRSLMEYANHRLRAINQVLARSQEGTRMLRQLRRFSGQVLRLANDPPRDLDPISIRNTLTPEERERMLANTKQFVDFAFPLQRAVYPRDLNRP